MGRKALKRKLGKRVLSGKLTVDEARARLGRGVAQNTYKTASSGWPEQPVYEPPRVPDRDYVLAATRAPYPRPAPAIAKSRKQAAPSRVLAKVQAREAAKAARMREIAAGAAVPAHPSAYTPELPPPVVVKQLTQPERNMVADLRRQRELTRDPFTREQIGDQIIQITGNPFSLIGGL